MCVVSSAHMWVVMSPLLLLFHPNLFSTILRIQIYIYIRRAVNLNGPHILAHPTDTLLAPHFPRIASMRKWHEMNTKYTYYAFLRNFECSTFCDQHCAECDASEKLRRRKQDVFVIRCWRNVSPETISHHLTSGQSGTIKALKNRWSCPKSETGRFMTYGYLTATCASRRNSDCTSIGIRVLTISCTAMAC